MKVIPLLLDMNPLEKGMVTHSSILAWRIPWTEESGGVQSMGSQRVGHIITSSLPFDVSFCSEDVC